ncbi:hypothetical protein [Rhizomonospora bruguierae]|uniref:hypothetical protein n=1 Tax=Rhizomonospora bruguierae TaxID=1581705 RepID=UPI001BCC0AB3|nr:hypothetical protein [Micromonospora sp. NBRC 107566]
MDRRTLIKKTAAVGVGLAAAVPASLLWTAAYESAQVSKAVMPIDIAPGTVDDLRGELHRLANDYVHTSDLPRIIGSVILLRDRLAVQVDPRRPHPRQARELYLMMGATCLLLASISHDLGESDAGMMQAKSAEVFADLAEYPELTAWVLCTQAMIDLWRQRPADALRHAERGRAMSITGSGSVRLTGLHVRALAQLNRKDEAKALLPRVERTAGRVTRTDALAELGTVFSFPETRQRYYAAVSHTELGNYPAVERAVAALGHDDQPPSSSDGAWPISWALSRCYLALARLDHRGSDGGPEAAAQALRPVLSLAEPQRINQLGQVFDQINGRLTTPMFSGNSTAQELRDTLHNFRPDKRLAVTGG